MTALNHQESVAVSGSDEAPGYTGRRTKVVLIALAGGLFLMSMVLSRDVTGPVFYEDELGYLANARYLAGTRAVPDLAPMGYYYPGYSLVISPLYLLPIGPATVHRAMLILNALLGSLQFLLGYILLRRVFSVEMRVAMWAALGAALYPGVLLIQNYLFADNLFRVVLIACAIAAGLFVKKASLRRGAVLGLLAAFAFAVHPRGLGVVLVTAALFILTALMGRPRAAAIGLMTVIPLTIGIRLLNRSLAAAIYESGDRSVWELLSKALEADFWLELPLRAIGQFWYLTVATFGLFPIGVMVAGLGAWRCIQLLRRRDRASPGDATMLYVISASALLFGISVAFMTPPDGTLGRLDHLVYGRYNDAFVVVFVMFALSYLLESWDQGYERHRALWRWPGIALALMTCCAVALGVFATPLLASGRPYAPTSALGIAAYASQSNIPLLAATAWGLALGLLLWFIVPRFSRRAGVFLVFAAFIVSSFVAQERVLSRFNEPWMNMLTIQASIAHIGAPGLIGYDEAGLSEYGLNGYQFWLDLSVFEIFDSESEQPPSNVSLVIASETWEKGLDMGARLVAIERNLNQGLWVLPGAIQKDLGTAGYLLPSDPTSPLPAEAMASDIEIRSGLRPGESMASDESRILRMAVRHVGKGTPWIPLGSWAESPVHGSVRLVARWIPVGDGDVAAIQIAELPQTVLPGEEVHVDLAITPSGSDGRLDSGDYVLRFGLIQQGGRWFEEAGDPQLDVRVHVDNDL